MHLFHSQCYRIGVFQGTNLRINFKKKEKTYQKFLLFRTILVISHSISKIEFDGLCHFSMFDVPIYHYIYIIEWNSPKFHHNTPWSMINRKRPAHAFADKDSSYRYSIRGGKQNLYTLWRESITFFPDITTPLF